MNLSIDIETFSSVDIQKSGLYRYVQAPDFGIMLLAYAFDDGPVQVIDLMALGAQEALTEVRRALLDPRIVKRAYNAAFEWYCLSKFLGLTCEETTRWLNQWRCTMAQGLYCGYPAGLSAVGEALGLPQDKRKLGTGGALIRTFCVPTKPTAANGHRVRTLPHHEPERWQLFKTYCAQDVSTEREVARRLAAFPLPEAEQALWAQDLRINAFGVCVGAGLVEGALECGAVVAQSLMGEAVTLSGLDNPKSVQQLSKWLNEQLDEEITDLRKDTVTALIKTVDDDKTRRVLQIRQELSKTSTKKYDAMKAAMCEDGRVRGLLQYYGANRTGRWAGRLVQVQNLPRNHMDTLDLARDLTCEQKTDHLRVLYGNVPDVLSQLIRTAFVPSPGNVLLVADFSAIEARVIAWLAGEQWVMDAFATHGKIYEATAAQMFGIPLEHIVKGRPEYEYRQKGKVATLACGYQGSIGALKAMGADQAGATDDELLEIVRRWRSANRRIVDLWYSLERAALEVMRTGQPQGVRGLIIAREGSYENQLDWLTIRLPSGRKLFYPRPFLQINDKEREALHYHGVNQQTRKWEVVPTYGGKLVENVVQAIARDCLAQSLVWLEGAGYQTVMHIHDEVVIDCPVERGDIRAVCDLMGQPIDWAPGLLLRAEGFVTPYYKKD